MTNLAAPDELIHAAIYPDAIALAAMALTDARPGQPGNRHAPTWDPARADRPDWIGRNAVEHGGGLD